MTALPIGKLELRREGRSGLLLLSAGPLLQSVLTLGEQLDATVANLRFIKPLDTPAILSLAERAVAVVTIEENAVIGGVGSAVAECLAAAGLSVPLRLVGIPDRFIEHGSRDDCLALAGLDLAGLTGQIEPWWAAMQSTLKRRVRGAPA
jgi:1-deoxy-D-xylulose-5-phosphate synthase